MKPFALAATAVLLASPAVFAQDKDLCEINMTQVESNMATNSNTLGDPAKSEVEDLIAQAKQAQSSGDTEGCITHTTKALQLLEGPGSSDSQGTAGSSSGSSN
ncbi:hypothetical protein [Stutzerimonas azotifigens]|uniref:hypothetical protein n=1 Tax=Stutzerimonas azotifigens TaxID=291995 RepID=UPI00040FE559|nr:hypothetical protein [Stutzerimonas azotifigens]